MDTNWTAIVPVSDKILSLKDLLSTLNQQECVNVHVVCVAESEQVNTFPARPDVTMLRHPADRSYMRASHEALRLALERRPKEEWKDYYIAWIHPDILFEPRAFLQAQVTFEADPDLLLIAPKILQASLTYANDEREVVFGDVIESAGAKISANCEWVIRGQNKKDQGQFENQEVGALPTSACIFIRASLFLHPHWRYKERWWDVNASESAGIREFLLWVQAIRAKSSYVPSVITWHHEHRESLDKPGFLGYKRWYTDTAKTRRKDVFERLRFILIYQRFNSIIRLIPAFILNIVKWIGLCVFDRSLFFSGFRAFLSIPYAIVLRWKRIKASRFGE